MDYDPSLAIQSRVTFTITMPIVTTRVILTEQKTRTVKTKIMISRGLLTRKTKLNKKMKYFRHGFTELLSLLLPGAIFKVKNILMFKS